MGLVDLGTARRAGILQFGEPVTYQPAAGGSFTVEAVWSGPHEQVVIGDGAGISTTAPTFGVDLADFPSEPLAGDTLVRQSTGYIYRVDDVQLDGEGGAKLALHRTG